MIGEIICVGNELLIGDTLNTNTYYLSQQLTQLGIDVSYQSVVGDHEKHLTDAINLASRRSDVVVFSGGLGPTYDDMTKETVAKCLEMPLVTDEEALSNLKAYFDRRGIQMADNNLKQTLRPIEGSCLPNNNGTAPGIYVKKADTHYILLPGPPNELKPMFVEQAVPILKNLSEEVIASKIMKLIGIGESDLAIKIGHIMDHSDNLRIAPYAKLGAVNIRITAKADTELKAKTMVDKATDMLMPYVEAYCYTDEDKELEEIIIEKLIKKGLTLATAESCTGGLLGARLINVSGASKVFMNGFITYSNDAKCKVLGIESTMIESYGAVSEEVARAMAVRVKQLSQTDIGIGITGIAGPEGGTKEKPVGTVHVAVAYGEDVVHKKLSLKGLRQKIRDYSVQYALMILFDII